MSVETRTPTEGVSHSPRCLTAILKNSMGGSGTTRAMVLIPATCVSRCAEQARVVG